MEQDATKIMQLCSAIVDVPVKLAQKMKINRLEGRIYLYKFSKPKLIQICVRIFKL